MLQTQVAWDSPVNLTPGVVLAATRQGLWRAPIGLRLTIFEPKFNFRKSLFVDS